jgi:hypothetical protein
MVELLLEQLSREGHLKQPLAASEIYTEELLLT